MSTETVLSSETDMLSEKSDVGKKTNNTKYMHKLGLLMIPSEINTEIIILR